MATITLKSPDGSTDTFECDEDTIILEALEEAGLDHNSSCRAGACSACAMKLESGTVSMRTERGAARLFSSFCWHPKIFLREPDIFFVGSLRPRPPP